MRSVNVTLGTKRFLLFNIDGTLQNFAFQKLPVKFSGQNWTDVSLYFETKQLVPMSGSPSQSTKKLQKVSKSRKEQELLTFK